jgi:hypothetical protein
MNANAPAHRHLAATVAQYIHELSERHAKDREAVAVAVAVAPPVPQHA